MTSFRPNIRDTFFLQLRPRVYFYTSNHAKFLQARNVFDEYGLDLTHFRSRREPYDEVYDRGREYLLSHAVAEIAEAIGRNLLFFIEDTSVRIEALSGEGNDFPGLKVKEWFRQTTFEELDAELRERGDNRTVCVRSDIALHLPNLQPVLFAGETEGKVADEPPTFEASSSHPWLTPETFNGWFQPIGAETVLGAMSFQESWEYDFRIRAFKQLIDRLEEYTGVLNLPPQAYVKVQAAVSDRGMQISLLPREEEVIAVVGYPCSGKTEFGKRAKNIPQVRHLEASSVLRGMKGPEHEDMKAFDFARVMLDEHGADVVARKIVEDLLKFSTHDTIVITGFRTIQEIACIRDRYSDVSVVLLDVDRRTRYQRQIQRRRGDTVETFEEFKERDRKQKSFGLLGVARDLADVLMQNPGTSDRSLKKYQERVARFLEGDPDISGVSRDVVPRQTLKKERLYRSLRALEEKGRPLTATEIGDAAGELSKGMAQRNVNQALKEFPELARRRRLSGQQYRYRITEAGLAYLRQRERREETARARGS